jgi:MFS family permease
MALTIPRAGLMLLGGALSDRLSARNIVIAANLVMALAVAAVAVLVVVHRLELWQLYVVALTFGIADAFAIPAMKVLLPTMVERDQIQGANALYQSTTQIATLIGAPLAGVLIQKSGLALVFFFDAATFVVLVLALLTVPRQTNTRSRKGGVWRSVAEGLLHLKGNRWLQSVILVIAGINFCVTGAMQVGVAAIAHFRFNSSSDFGLMVTGCAIGSLTGVVVAGAWRHAWSFATTMLSSCLLLALSLIALGLPSPLWLIFVVIVFMGVIAGYVNVYAISALQKIVRSDMLGRVMSLVGIASVAVAPLSVAIGGFLARSNTSGLFYWSGGALLFLTIFIALRGGLADPVEV